MKDKLLNLLGVRSIITLCLTGVLCYGFIVGKIESKDFLVYVAMVFTFFFNKVEKEKVQEQVEEKIKAQEPKDLGGVG